MDSTDLSRGFIADEVQRNEMGFSTQEESGEDMFLEGLLMADFPEVYLADDLEDRQPIIIEATGAAADLPTVLHCETPKASGATAGGMPAIPHSSTMRAPVAAAHVGPALGLPPVEHSASAGRTQASGWDWGLEAARPDPTQQKA